MQRFIRSNLLELKQQGVRVMVIGDRETLEQPTRALIEYAERETSTNSKLTLVIAFNYGGRNEIVRAVKRIVEEVKNDPTFTDVIDEACFANHLDSGVHTIPDVDLLIRTGGEKRISNFLLWQCAYAELVFVDEYWPDFNEKSFADAIRIYSSRNRRFGAIPDHDASTHAPIRATG
jgi:undecaprenyl diphosphate synthase